MKNGICFAEESIQYGGMNLTYRADYSEKDKEFSVSVKKDGEHATVKLGSDFYNAAAFYEEIKKGGVTPCTLTDVYEDFLYRSGNLKKSLYNSAIV